jgi:non-specific serine/threonine protein kinase
METSGSSKEGSRHLDGARIPDPTKPDADGRKPDTSTPRLPESIGRYPIVSEAGRDATGVVYVAEDPRLRRKIAIKVLPEATAGEIEAIERFKREGKVLAALNHPNIATIHSFEEAEGSSFFTMELITGETLEERLQTGPFSPRDALEFCSQVASALEAAHGRGIVHRNLNSQNVRFAEQGHVKVLDFGISRTPASGESEEQRTDIWAFGGLLFECLTGHRVPPTDAQSDTTEIHAPDLSLLPMDIPPAVRTLISHCLSTDPGARPKSIAEVSRQIEGEIGRLSTSVSGAGLEAGRWPNNLPLQLASFVGRLDETKALRGILKERRLVTLTGMGGCGKTRLALEVARQSLPRFPDGTWLIELGAIRNPDQVAQTVAQVLKLRDEKGRSMTETLVSSLTSKDALLILDSCEHVLSGVSPLVSTLLWQAPNLRILATSHERLGIQGEEVFPVPPLRVPTVDDEASAEHLSKSEAAQLFLKRATEAHADFQVTEDNARFVAQVCRRLDGIPLALELAATRVRVLSVEEISHRLDDRFRLLRGGSKTAPPRLQTLRATMDWSYELLSPEEQKLLRTLSVFAGSWTQESAASVCKAGDELPDSLSQLVERSLVMREVQEKGRTRFRLLETVRQYAAEKLKESGESKAAHDLLTEHLVSLLEKAEPELRGPKQAEWLKVMESEQENLLASIGWCQEQGLADRALLMTRCLAWFWLVRGYLGFGRSVISKVLALPLEGKPTRLQAQVMDRAGLMARVQADYEAARSLHEESLAVYQEIEWESGIASALGNLANVAVEMGDYEVAGPKLEEALAIYRKIGAQRGIANNLTNLAVIDNDQGRFEQAKIRLKESVTIYSELGDMSSLAAAFCNLGISLGGLNELESARTLIEEAIGIYRDLGEKISLAFVLEDLSRINARMGNHLVAAMQLRECLSLAVEVGEKQTGVLALEGTAELAAAIEEPETSVQLLAASDALRDAIGAIFPPRLADGRDAVMKSLQSTLDDASFRVSWDKGEVMSFESATEFALEWLFGV